MEHSEAVLALSAGANTRFTRTDESDEDEAPSYMTVADGGEGNLNRQEKFCRMMETEDDRRRQRSVMARIPETFKQLPMDRADSITRTGAETRLKLQPAAMARKLLEIPLFQLD